MAKEVRALFPGRYEARVHGYKLSVVANGNGSLAGSAFNRTDKGRWWVKGTVPLSKIEKGRQAFSASGMYGVNW